METLVQRVERRHADVSDADAAVVQRQAAGETGQIGWHRLGAEVDLDALVVEANAAGGLSGPRSR